MAEYVAYDERDLLFGALRRVRALLKRSPTAPDLGLDDTDQLAKFRAEWIDLDHQARGIISGGYRAVANKLGPPSSTKVGE